VSNQLYAVIMAGGSGTRFWPASRRSRPKQFLAVTGEVSLLAATRDRLTPLVADDHILVVAATEHAELVREALPDLPPENLLLEPVGRNTLPCVALANAEIRRRDPDAVQVVLPADHVIAPAESFRESLAAAAEVAASSEALVTFGIRPTHPATGYGYVEIGSTTGELEGSPVFAVVRFVEKPDQERAEEFLRSGHHLWNSGIFVWTTAAITKALETSASVTWKALRDAKPGELGEIYPGLEAISVDVGVMETAPELRVIPIDYTWSDVGSWGALAELVPADGDGNRRLGGTLLEALDSEDNLVYGESGELTALVGVSNLVVVRAGDAVLVCDRSRTEEVKALVERLKDSAPEQL